MSDIPAITSKKLIKLLLKFGFELERTKGSHHIYRRKDDGRIAVVPKHNDDLPIGTLMEILKQAGIDKKELTNI